MLVKKKQKIIEKIQRNLDWKEIIQQKYKINRRTKKISRWEWSCDGGKVIIVALMLLLIIVTIEYKMFSKIYLSLHKVHLFDIQDRAVREQINYVLDEDEIIGKASMAHWAWC